MNRNDLRQQLERFVPFNEQEENDLELIRQALAADNIFSRENETMHMTASAWVVNRAYSKVLMAYHRIYDSWAWLGGHADGQEDLLSVAVREVKEESGLTDVIPVSDEILSVEIIPVSGHEKKGHYVSSHLHLNVTYLLQADEAEPVHSREEENKAVAWFTPEAALAASDEPWFVERIYPKLIARAVRNRDTVSGEEAELPVD